MITSRAMSYLLLYPHDRCASMHPVVVKWTFWMPTRLSWSASLMSYVCNGIRHASLNLVQGSNGLALERVLGECSSLQPYAQVLPRDSLRFLSPLNVFSDWQKPIKPVWPVLGSFTSFLFTLTIGGERVVSNTSQETCNFDNTCRTINFAVVPSAVNILYF